MPDNLPSPSTASCRSIRPVPLLSLAQPALALGEHLALGEPGDENNVGEIWNVITRAADLVKDGERLENLAWRHWGQPSRPARRLSTSSFGTASTASIHTLHTPNDPVPFLHRTRSFEKRTFGGALKLLLEKDEHNFKDWVEEAKKHYPPAPTPVPTISVPDTPVANVEIRLVEPTPVPSRVGSMGGSMSAAGLLGAVAVVPPALHEDEDEEEEDEEEVMDERQATIAPTNTAPASHRIRPPKKKGKFFVQSSPTKGSASDTSQHSHTSPIAPPRVDAPSAPSVAALPKLSKHNRRKSSGDSSTGLVKPDMQHPPVIAQVQKRHISLSTMRGKYHAEKRRVAEAMEQKERQAKENEESGWEDEDEEEIEEDWSDEEEGGAAKKGKGQETSPGPQDKRNLELGRRASSSSKPAARSKSHTHLDLGALLSRKVSRSEADWETPPQSYVPPPPAPTPLRNMSKKERAKAAAEQARIDAQMQAAWEREMFAKKQIFGDTRPPASRSLLANALRGGGASMVDLQTANSHCLRSSPTHGQLTSLAQSPTPGPSLLRSKSAVAMPVQTGISVTIPPHALHSAASKKGETSSQERAKAELELESDDEDSDTDANYLNTPRTKQKLAEVLARREAKAQAQSQPPTLAPALPLTLPTGQRVDEYGIVQPMTPTTRRRTIITAEMSESLRKNVVLERQKSAGAGIRSRSFGALHHAQALPPVLSGGGQRLQSHMSADNLQQYGQPEGQLGQPLERHNSQPTRLGHGGFGGGCGGLPTVYSEANSPVNAHSSIAAASGTETPLVPPPPPEVRKRSQHTLLGGAYLRPLTRVGTAPNAPTLATTGAGNGNSGFSANNRNNSTPALNRTLSSAVIAETASAGTSTYVQPRGNHVHHHNSVSFSSSHLPEAPAMQRRLTDGEGLQMTQMMMRDREAKRREMVKRRETTDTSYRMHGW